VYYVIEISYLERIVKYKDCIHKEIKRRLLLGNACCHSVQNWFHIIRDEHNIRKFERNI
jgi:hypothetical protein